MSLRLKIILWLLLGFVLGIAQAYWERSFQRTEPLPAPAIAGTTLV